jgi:hypothetical protein
VPFPVRSCLVLSTDNFMCHVPGTDLNCSGIPNSCYFPEQGSAYKLQTVQCSGGYHPLKENRPHEPKHQRGGRTRTFFFLFFKFYKSGASVKSGVLGTDNLKIQKNILIIFAVYGVSVR